MKYRTIVADPPWEVGAGPGWNPNGQSRALPYPIMTVEAIASIPIQKVIEAEAHLYLWTINAYIEAAYTIARRWGFKPSTLLTWCKAPNGLGLGGTFSLTTEHVLFCRRGVCPSPIRMETTWWQWPRGRHSEKPAAFLDMVEQVSPGPRLELFSRSNRLGWHTWGNECLNHVEMAPA
jgi:N6-adenosine-specific RNA methylase IME4